MQVVLNTPNARSTGAAAQFSADEAAEVVSIFAHHPEAQRASPPPRFTDDGSGNSGGYQLNFTPIQKWTKTRERRFSTLAARKALGEATSEELGEMEELRVLRRRMKSAPSTDEVLYQYERREREARVLKELQQYVAFLNAPRGA